MGFTSYATSTGVENVRAKISGNKSLWKPTFEWEDFPYSGMILDGNGGSFKVSDFTKSNGSSAEEIVKQIVGSGCDDKVCLRDEYRPLQN